MLIVVIMVMRKANTGVKIRGVLLNLVSLDADRFSDVTFIEDLVGGKQDS